MWNLAGGYLYFCLQRFYSKSSWWKYLQRRHNNVINMQIIPIAFLILPTSTVKYHLFHKWHMKKYDWVCDTLIFNRNAAVSSSSKNFSLSAIPFTQFVWCLHPFISDSQPWFSHSLSLFCPPSPLTRGFAVGCAPRSSGTSAGGCRGCVGCADVLGSWTPSAPLSWTLYLMKRRLICCHQILL